MRPEGVEFMTADGTRVEREIERIDWNAEEAEKGGHETFMLKEIHEQADAVAETIADRTARRDGVDLPEIDDDLLRDCKRIVVVACGTSYHAGLIGRYALEEWARVPVEMDVASEYRYRNPVVGPGDLVIGITQSGETADTLAAMRLARERGATVLAITNIMGSQVTRDADGVLLHARRGSRCPSPRRRRSWRRWRRCTCSRCAWPSCAARCPRARLRRARRRAQADPARDHRDHGGLARTRSTRVAEAIHDQEFFLYLGRHVGLAVCLEGALKLKEISYISTDAYAAGEMKHGPIALLEDGTPVVVVATESPVLEKVISNMQEVRARGARVIAVTTEGDERVAPHAEEDADRAERRLDAPADPRGHPAAAAGLPDRAAARPQRRPAAQPRQDRHRRVARRPAAASAAAILSARADAASSRSKRPLTCA